MSGLKKYKGIAYLLLLVVVLPWFVYRIAIAQTMEMRREARRDRKEIRMLEKQRPSRDREVEASVSTVEELQNGEFVSRITADGRCPVVKYTPYITENQDGLTVHTAELVLSGTYADLLRTIDLIEQEFESCRLVSTTFRSVRLRQNKEIQLQSTLVVQQITQNL